jgi:hypothetical protein
MVLQFLWVVASLAIFNWHFLRKVISIVVTH